MTIENNHRLTVAARDGDAVAVSSGHPVRFEWGVQNANGGWFRLLREPHHTAADITDAKRSLRNNRDVVSLGVEVLK
jgi:hypothetical protein